MNIKRLLATLALAAWSLTAAALPTLEEVQAEVSRGNYAHAEAMMQDVVSARPGSARAHYIYAEILAHNKRFDEAAKQAASARAVDPAIGFTEPAKFKAFEELLAKEQQAAGPSAAMVPSPAHVVRSSPPQQSSGLPGWVWAFGLAGLLALVWTVLTRRRLAAAASMGTIPGSMVPAGTAGYGPAPSAGSGLLGVGLAAAGGVAAGMLTEKMLSGHGQPDIGSHGSAIPGGLVPGMFDDAPADDAVARELEQRQVDFGSGDDWGGGDGGAGQGDDGW